MVRSRCVPVRDECRDLYRPHRRVSAFSDLFSDHRDRPVFDFSPPAGLSSPGEIQWRGRRIDRQTSQDLNAALGINFLHALLLHCFLGGSSSFVALDFGDVVGIVDIP